MLSRGLPRGGGSRYVVGNQTEKADALIARLTRRVTMKKKDFQFFGKSPARARQEELFERKQQQKVDRIAMKEMRRLDLMRCRLMLPWMAAGRFLEVLMTRLERVRRAKRIVRRNIDAQIRIATWYKTLVVRRRFTVIAALAHMGSLAFGVKMHLRRRRTAINRIRTFLRETERNHHIFVARRRICNAVRTLQRAGRNFYVCTTARLQCLQIFWDHAASAHAENAEIAFLRAQQKDNATLLRKKFMSTTTTTKDQDDDHEQDDDDAAVDRAPSRTSGRSYAVRQLELEQRREQYRWLAQRKLKRRKEKEFERLIEQKWASIDTRLDGLQERALAQETIQAVLAKQKQSQLKIPVVPVDMKDALLWDLLGRIRLRHQTTWVTDQRTRFRDEKPKVFSIAEARDILHVDDHAAGPKSEGTAPVTHHWPHLAFFLQTDVGGDPTGPPGRHLPPLVHPSVGSSWDSQKRNTKHLRDVVTELYEGAIAELVASYDDDEDEILPPPLSSANPSEDLAAAAPSYRRPSTSVSRSRRRSSI